MRTGIILNKQKNVHKDLGKRELFYNASGNVS